MSHGGWIGQAGQASQTIFLASHRQRGCFSASRPTGVARACVSASRERGCFSASAFACWGAPRGRGDAAAGSATRVQNWAAWHCVPRPRKEASAQASAVRHILCKLFQTVPSCLKELRTVSNCFEPVRGPFQTVSECSELFRTVSDCFRCLYLGGALEIRASRQAVPPDCFKQFQAVSGGFKLFRSASNCFKRFQTLSNAKRTQNGPAGHARLAQLTK